MRRKQAKSRAGDGAIGQVGALWLRSRLRATVRWLCSSGSRPRSRRSEPKAKPRSRRAAVCGRCAAATARGARSRSRRRRARRFGSSRPIWRRSKRDARIVCLARPTRSVSCAPTADHLGLDSAEILRRFRREAGGLDGKARSFVPDAARRAQRAGRRNACWSALILAICGYGTWYYLSTGEHSRPERVTEVPATLLPPKPAEASPRRPPAQLRQLPRRKRRAGRRPPP